MVVQEIKEIQQVLQLKFRLRMTWVDARLDFFNIKMDETMNVVSLDELNRIWLPIIIFDNTEEGQITINDGKSFATINRTGQGTGSDSSISEDIDIYKGSENSISLSRLYNIDFFCDFDMRWYPFDAQTCFMIMKLGGGTEKLVSLAPGLLEYLGPEELTQYYVQKYSISETTLRNANKGLRTSITFGRRLLGTILTVYLPTVLLNVIGHATNFFKPFFFEAVVTVNLTGKLLLIQDLLISFFSSDARAHHHVHKCVKQPAQDVVCQGENVICTQREFSRITEDDRHLAHLQSSAAIHRGSCAHIHGHPKVSIATL